jgi:hypothetical protein
MKQARVRIVWHVLMSGVDEHLLHLRFKGVVFQICGRFDFLLLLCFGRLSCLASRFFLEVAR